MQAAPAGQDGVDNGLESLGVSESVQDGASGRMPYVAVWVSSLLLDLLGQLHPCSVAAGLDLLAQERRYVQN